MSVGLSITAEITPESRTRFERALAAVVGYSRKTIAGLVADLAFNFSREAYLRTKKGKALVNAKVADLHRRAAASQDFVSQKAAGASKFTGTWLWTWVKTRDGFLRLPMPAKWAKENGLTKVGALSRHVFRKSEWQGNRQVVRNRGFSKGGWVGIIKKLGKAMGAEKEDDKGADAYTARWKFAGVEKRGGTDTAGVSIHQGVPPAVEFLDKRDAIMARSFTALLRNLERMKRQHAESIRQSWERA